MLYEMFNWRWSKWMILCLVFLSVSFTQGEIYNKKRMAVVTTFPSSLNTVCVVPLSERPRVAIRVDLKVISGTTHDVVTAGFVNIRNKLLVPIHSQHKLTVEHIVDDATLHILKVLLDGVEVEFVQSPNYDWTDFYQFHHIALSLRGTADISPCEHPTTYPPYYPTTTPSTTTTPPPTTTLTTTQEPPPQPPFFHYRPSEDEDETASFDGHTTTAPPSGEIPDEDDVVYMRQPLDPLGEPAYTNLSRNETFEEGDLDAGDEESEDDEPWWRFLYILGDYKRIPLLLILLIVFCVGAGIGSVATIICEQYCCCRDDNNCKNSDYDGEEFRHFSRTDFMRPSANATFVGAVDTSGRLSKENIGHPIPPSGSRSSESYHTPYQHPPQQQQQQLQRERYICKNPDETLPLNMPLPQDNQRVKNGNYNQFNKYQDTYQ